MAENRENVDIRKMVEGFRVMELSSLLSFAGKIKTGPKVVLMKRAMELLNSPSQPIIEKIVSLSNAYKLERKRETIVRTIDVGNRVTSNGSTNFANPNDAPPQGPFNANDARAQARPNPNALLSAGQVPHPNNPPVATDFDHLILKPVKFREIPFFDVLEEVVKTTVHRVTPNQTQYQFFELGLSVQQVNEIVYSRGVHVNPTKVQLRICLLEKMSEAGGYFPHQTVVRVNDKLVPLPSPISTHRRNEQARCPSVPLDITEYLHLVANARNTVMVSWGFDQRLYAMRVALVRPVNVSELLFRLTERGWLKSDYTRSLISKNFKDINGDIATTALTLSLKCPLTKTRIIYPCRAYNCLHLQCFDASSYLQINAIKEKWLCPICSQPAQFDNLVLDGYVREILNSLFNSTAEEVVFSDSYLWKVPDEVAGNKSRRSANGRNVTIAILVDDDVTEKDDERPISLQNGNVTLEQSTPIIDLTSSDSEDNEPLVIKRSRLAKR